MKKKVICNLFFLLQFSNLETINKPLQLELYSRVYFVKKDNNQKLLKLLFNLQTKIVNKGSLQKWLILGENSQPP